ncbi:MAG: SusD/RagB family nutrient-binding outer membrane lipoprotein [Cyclobacteriaceae bacterium]|nr:SusD/RagB family nutrient-binding outer membrane lipoprotein [Cyclobacteriaceae bacterium]
MKKLHIRTILLGVLMMGACTSDFEEINTNPNSPTTVAPQLLLPQVMRDMMNSLMNETWGIGNIVVQHTAKNQFVNEDRYLWGELNAVWNAVYDNARDVNNIILIADEQKLSNTKAVALIVKSWMFSLATDAYGDIPYKEATSAKTGINYPVYDTQESVYQGILADLAEANTLLATGTDAVTGDPIYKGTLMNWRKLANSLRIRYLMRISDRTNVGSQITAILSDPSANPIFEGNEDNGVYSYLASSPDQFPNYTQRIGSFNEFRASKTMVDWLEDRNDPRVEIYFRATPATENTPDPSDDVIVGIPNGLGDVEAQEFNGGQQNQSRIGALFYENSISAQGLNVAKGVIMTYAELNFLLAEAAEKNLITASAEDYYLEGIEASFDFYGVDPGAGYYAQAEVAYTGTQQEKLVKIGEQKWASLYYQGLEAWFDWRRTNIPVLVPSVTNQNNNRIPVRFIYPIIEQALNGTNRATAVGRQGADDLNSRVWWDVNANN